MITIALTTIIASAIFFALGSALDSFAQTRDRLILQKSVSEVMDRLLSGLEREYALKDALEVIRAGRTRIEFVPPWTDDTHTSAAGDFVYTLNRRMKPGSGFPIGEIKLAAAGLWKLVPVEVVDSEDAQRSRVQIGYSVLPGSDLRFTYHPDPERYADALKSYWWNAETEQIYSDSIEGIEVISKNPFGVTFKDFRLTYYDNTNSLVTRQDRVDFSDMHLITGIEVYLKGGLEGQTEDLLSFVNMRNAPLKSGRLSLKEGMEIPIPNSEDIHTLFITNLTGITSGDEIRLEAVPNSGKTWRVKVVFERKRISVRHGCYGYAMERTNRQK